MLRYHHENSPEMSSFNILDTKTHPQWLLVLGYEKDSYWIGSVTFQGDTQGFVRSVMRRDLAGNMYLTKFIYFTVSAVLLIRFKAFVKFCAQQKCLTQRLYSFNIHEINHGLMSNLRYRHQVPLVRYRRRRSWTAHLYQLKLTIQRASLLQDLSASTLLVTGSRHTELWDLTGCDVRY